MAAPAVSVLTLTERAERAEARAAEAERRLREIRQLCESQRANVTSDRDLAEVRVDLLLALLDTGAGNK
jgi:hypothetical protein